MALTQADDLFLQLADCLIFLLQECVMVLVLLLHYFVFFHEELYLRLKFNLFSFRLVQLRLQSSLLHVSSLKDSVQLGYVLRQRLLGSELLLQV